MYRNKAKEEEEVEEGDQISESVSFFHILFWESARGNRLVFARVTVVVLVEKGECF